MLCFIFLCFPVYCSKWIFFSKLIIDKKAQWTWVLQSFSLYASGFWHEAWGRRLSRSFYCNICVTSCGFQDIHAIFLICIMFLNAIKALDWHQYYAILSLRYIALLICTAEASIYYLVEFIIWFSPPTLYIKFVRNLPLLSTILIQCLSEK